jgi:hypothetical protein
MMMNLFILLVIILLYQCFYQFCFYLLKSPIPDRGIRDFQVKFRFFYLLPLELLLPELREEDDDDDDDELLPELREDDDDDDEAGEL